MRAPRDGDAAIVGAGCVSALGYGVDVNFAALDEGRTALAEAPEHAVHASWGPLARLAEPFLRIDVPREMDPQIKFLSGSGELSVEATDEAIRAAGLLTSGVEAERRGLYLSQMDSYDWECADFDAAMRAATEDFAEPLEQEAFNRESARRVLPFFMLESLKNNAFSFLSTMYELRGANTSVAGFAGPTHLTLDMAVRSLARGSFDAGVVVAAARPTSVAARAEMAERGIDQAPGDGAAALVLRRRGDVEGDHAVALGLGSATRAVEPESTVPSTDALRDAGRQALQAAGADAGDVAAVVVPGLGESDLEGALADLPAAANAPHVTWTPAWGHCALAAETMQVALAARCLSERRVPGGPTVDDGQALLVLGAGLLGQASAVVLARS